MDFTGRLKDLINAMSNEQATLTTKKVQSLTVRHDRLLVLFQGLHGLRFIKERKYLLKQKENATKEFASINKKRNTFVSFYW